MKVIIDARMVGPTLHGFARYVTLMAQGLKQVRRESGRLLYDPVFMVQPEVKKAPERFGFDELELLPLDAPFLNPKELWEIPKVLSAAGAALYHSPTFSSLLYCPCPWVVTVHDLNHLQFGGLKERLYYQFILRRFAQKAEALLTVSEFSRREIAQWLNLNESVIEVIPNALDPGFLVRPPTEEITTVLNRFGLEPGKYFFCLSNPKPHKNVKLLAEAYGVFRKQLGCVKSWDLVLSMGCEAFPASDGIRWTGALPEYEARALVFGAGALFFPSLYEGFGLPPVEAASIGVPLFVSRIAPHQEGLSDLAASEVCLVEPTDFHGWVNAFHKALRGEGQTVSEANRAKIRLRFSVAGLGYNMDRIYRRALGVP
jgi:glycosyltransferase involved in cell wall biosynthesis